MAENTSRIEGKKVWVTLTQGKETCVDLDDWPKVSCFRWHAQKSRNVFYAYTGSSKQSMPLHLFLIGVGGADHKDGNGLNNSRENLRPATCQQNCCNRKVRSTNTSGFKGVSFRSREQKWQARINFAGETFSGGYFDSAEGAALRYNEMAKEHHGEFAQLNKLP